MHRHDDGARRSLPSALIGVRRTRVEVNRVPGFQRADLVAVMNLQFTLQHIEEFGPRVHVRLGLHFLGQGKKLGKVRVHVPIGNHVAQALKIVSRIAYPGLWHSDALRASMYTEQRGGLALKEIRKILGEDHRDAGEIAQRRDHPARLQLRKETGGKTGVLAQFDKAHGLLEPQPLDTFADVFFRNEALGGFGINLRLLCFFALDHRCLTHCASTLNRQQLDAHLRQMLSDQQIFPCYRIIIPRNRVMVFTREY